MAKVFAITTTSTEKVPAEKGNATVVFTVTNTTSRPLRCMARLKPLGKTEMSWLKIDGEVERDLAAGSTDNFTIDFSRPAPAQPPSTSQQAETFQFRLDAVSAANPNEDFAEGSVVTVEIPETVVKVPKPFPWWIVAVAAGVLLVVGGVVLWLVFRNTNVDVPDETKKTYAAAETDLKEKGFTAAKVEEIAPTETPDNVFKQDPVGGTKSAPGATIKLSVPAMTTVPPLKNHTLDDAIKLLGSSGLKLRGITGDGDAIRNGTLNLVSDQDPKENTPAPKGSDVQVIFPCVPTPPFGRCLNIRDVKAVEFDKINPKIRLSIEAARQP